MGFQNLATKIDVGSVQVLADVLRWGRRHQRVPHPRCKFLVGVFTSTVPRRHSEKKRFAVPDSARELQFLGNRVLAEPRRGNNSGNKKSSWIGSIVCGSHYFGKSLNTE